MFWKFNDTKTLKYFIMYNIKFILKEDFTKFNLANFFLFLVVFCSCGNQSEKNLIDSKKENLVQLEDSFKFLYDIGNQKISTNDFKGAIPIFSKAILLNPNNADPFYCRGYALSAIGDDSAAVIDFDAAVRLMPDYKGAYFSRAVSYGILGRFNEAVRDYDVVIKLDSLFSNAWFNRGLIKVEIGNKNDGIKDIAKAAQLKDPKAIEFLK